MSGLTPAEQIRLALIWLAKGIREGNITRLTKSKKRSQEELATQWCLANQDRPRGSKLTALKDAQAAGLAKAEEEYEERRQKLYKEGGALIDQALAEGTLQFLWDPDADDRSNFDTLRAHYDGELEAGYEELTENNLEDYINSLIASGLDEDKAREVALEDLEEANAAAAELDDLEPDWELVDQMQQLGWNLYDSTVRVEQGLPLEAPPQDYIDKMAASKKAASERLKSISGDLDFFPSSPLEDRFF